MKGSNDAGNKEVVRQTTLVGLEPPKLKGMSMEEIIQFRRKRVEYEALVEEKNREPGMQIPITSYRNSIETRMLKMMYRAKWITADSFENISDDAIKGCIDPRCKRSFGGLSVKEIDEIVKNVRMKMNTIEPSSRVWTLVLDYEKALEDAGYEGILEKFAHIAIEHIVRKSEPAMLKSVLRDTIRLRRNEGIHKKDFFNFIELMVTKAEEVNCLERMQKAKTSEERAKERRPPGKQRVKADDGNKKSSKRKRTSNEAGEHGESSKIEGSRRFRFQCLLPEYDENHRIKDCLKRLPSKRSTTLTCTSKLRKKRRLEALSL